MSQEQWSTPPPLGAAANIPNYLIPAILSTVLCCLPLGVASIIFATQVNSKLATGDVAGAMEASKKAKMFMFIAVGLGLLTYAIVIVCWIIFGIAAVSTR
ncbi:MAG TPA: CD225/dispanin family protein [Pyrinomonadaceae bacterium]|jgi:hypothetical protein|nr:CD225/dispanin family protein [Pyrinomonadaceae bacterium]